MVGNMLQCNIKILAYILMPTHYRQQLIREICGIGIMESNPFHSFYLCHLIHKLCNPAFTIQVNSIICKLLSYNLEFFHTLRNELSDFIKYFFHFSAFILSRYYRYSTISTMAITTFAYLDIRIMLRCR